MRTRAVIFEAPMRSAMADLNLIDPRASDIVVATRFSGVSSGTERLLWEGRMPSFPGMGYPLVPGYESVGEIVAAGSDSGRRVGERVFVPGAACYRDTRGLFGAAAETLIVPATRVVTEPTGDDRGILLALAATAHHAIVDGLPDVIVGHGTLGRLIARLTLALGGAPTVWEREPRRREGARDYQVSAMPTEPVAARRICDASGADEVIDTLVPHLVKGGEIVLAGFYPGRVGFAFAPAFMRELRVRIAAEWTPADMAAVVALVEAGTLSLDDLVTHRRPAADAGAAYHQAFTDPDCLKMTLDWSH